MEIGIDLNLPLRVVVDYVINKDFVDRTPDERILFLFYLVGKHDCTGDKINNLMWM